MKGTNQKLTIILLGTVIAISASAEQASQDIEEKFMLEQLEQRQATLREKQQQLQIIKDELVLSRQRIRRADSELVSLRRELLAHQATEKRRQTEIEKMKIERLEYSLSSDEQALAEYKQVKTPKSVVQEKPQNDNEQAAQEKDEGIVQGVADAGVDLVKEEAIRASRTATKKVVRDAFRKALGY